MSRYIYLFLSIIVVLIIQIGVLPAIHSFLEFKIILPVLFFTLIAFLLDYSTTLTTAFVLGLFLDMYSAYFFGFYIIVFIIIALTIHFSLQNTFEHKNFATFIIINLLALFIYHLLTTLYILVAASFQGSSLSFSLNNFYLTNIGFSFVVHLLLVILSYYLIPSLRFRLKNGLVK